MRTRARSMAVLLAGWLLCAKSHAPAETRASFTTAWKAALKAADHPRVARPARQRSLRA